MVVWSRLRGRKLMSLTSLAGGIRRAIRYLLPAHSESMGVYGPVMNDTPRDKKPRIRLTSLSHGAG